MEDKKIEEEERPKKNKRKKEAQRALKYFIFAASAGVIQIIVDTALLAMSMSAEWAYFIAVVISVLWNFTFNRKYTFKSAGNVPVAMLKVGGYNAVFIPLSTWWTLVLTTTYAWTPFVTLIVTMVINFLTESVFYRFVVFGKSMDTNEQARKENEKK